MHALPTRTWQSVQLDQPALASSQQRISNMFVGSPICINTVLWNTIKLLFPKHAANAPESPADAILTPASANSTVIVANAVNALPARQRMLHAPFNPPRCICWGLTQVKAMHDRWLMNAISPGTKTSLKLK